MFTAEFLLLTQILQERAALEKGKLEEALEGEMKKVQDLAIQVTLLSEVCRNLRPFGSHSFYIST